MSTTITEPEARTSPKPKVAALAWGYNNAGGLGAAGSARSYHPIPTELPAGVVDVQGGTDFTVALTKAGDVYTWGGNRLGQLGAGALSKVRFAAAKVKIPGDPHVTAIAVGEDHVLALTTGGRVFAWGRNHHGQLGDGTRQDRFAPVSANVSRVEQLAAGNRFSAAITAGGHLVTWGSAIPATDHTDPKAVAALAESRFTPTPTRLQLPKGARAAMVDAGERHLVVLTTAGDLISLGTNAAGRPAPKQLDVPAMHGRVASISAGDNHTVALTKSGQLLTWGANYHGQLGNGTDVDSDVPVHIRVPKLRGRVVQAVAFGDTTLVRTSEGTLHAWGHGGWGQLGTGKPGNHLRPNAVPLPDHTAVTGVFVGRCHVIATTH